LSAAEYRTLQAPKHLRRDDDGAVTVIDFMPPLSGNPTIVRLSRYRRLTRAVLSRGAISHRPFSRVPRSAARHAWKSNRGQHSQSIDPSVATSAADLQSPISA
jgi:hypothetical protein